MPSFEDVIAACATPEGPGAVAMLRVSGPGTWDRLRHVVKPWPERPRVLTATKFHWHEAEPPCPGFLVLFERGYTGEECAELYVVSAAPLLRRLLERLRSFGVRPAQPGEFTRRAFVNGQLDLTQAESVAEIIAAEDLERVRCLRRTLEGRLGSRIHDLGERLHDVIALLEAGLDFSEQEVEPPNPQQLRALIEPILGDVERLQLQPEAQVQEAPRVRLLLYGRVNAGKSTLLNGLAGEDVAITSNVPGTTRDPVRATLELESGHVVELVDLAGERTPEEGADELEADAQELGRGWLRDGDQVLYVLDGTHPSQALIDEWTALDPEVRARAWPWVNKLDQLSDAEWSQLRCDVARAIPEIGGGSARQGAGLDDLRSRLVAFVQSGQWRSRGADYLFTERQVAQLVACSQVLTSALEAVDGGVTPELLVVDLGEAHACLEEITGAVTTEATLDRIFSRFCLGK